MTRYFKRNYIKLEKKTVQDLYKRNYSGECNGKEKCSYIESTTVDGIKPTDILNKTMVKMKSVYSFTTILI